MTMEQAEETTFDRGEPSVYEITWMTGDVERVSAHQVICPDETVSLFGTPGRARVLMHAEINGKWKLVLSARDEDIRFIRLVDGDELKVSPRGHIQGVDYGPCFGGCVPELPCRQTQGRHWYDNPANEKFAQMIKRG